MTEPPERVLVTTQDQEDLRAAVREVLTDHAPWTAILARIETDEPYDPALWQRLGRDLGIAGLLIPEEFDGAGGDARDLAVVAEEIGRAAAPVPFLGSAVLATSALLALTDGEPAAALLRELATGARTATLAVPAATVPAATVPAADPGLSADGSILATTVRASGDRLSGTVRPVLDLVGADVVLVPAIADDVEALYLVELAAPGVSVGQITSLDLTRPVAELTLEDVGAQSLATGQAVAEAVDRAVRTGAAILAAEQVGIASWALDTTVGYLKERHQFGRPLGSFQALKHRLAEVWRQVGLARVSAMAAADAVATEDDPRERAIAVAVAAAYCSSAAVLATEEMVQLHGGIGMTWEHPAHLYLARAKADELLFGAPDQHRAQIAVLVDLTA